MHLDYTLIYSVEPEFEVCQAVLCLFHCRYKHIQLSHCKSGLLYYRYSLFALRNDHFLLKYGNEERAYVI